MTTPSLGTRFNAARMEEELKNTSLVTTGADGAVVILVANHSGFGSLTELVPLPNNAFTSVIERDGGGDVRVQRFYDFTAGLFAYVYNGQMAAPQTISAQPRELQQHAALVKTALDLHRPALQKPPQKDGDAPRIISL